MGFMYFERKMSVNIVTLLIVQQSKNIFTSGMIYSGLTCI